MKYWIYLLTCQVFIFNTKMGSIWMTLKAF